MVSPQLAAQDLLKVAAASADTSWCRNRLVHMLDALGYRQMFTVGRHAQHPHHAHATVLLLLSPTMGSSIAEYVLFVSALSTMQAASCQEVNALHTNTHNL